MEESNLESKLQKAFEMGLSLSSGINYTKLEFAKSSEWDSIAHLHLIAAIEDEFGIMIETIDVLDMSSYHKAVEIVRKYVPTLS